MIYSQFFDIMRCSIVFEIRNFLSCRIFGKKTETEGKKEIKLNINPSLGPDLSKYTLREQAELLDRKTGPTANVQLYEAILTFESGKAGVIGGLTSSFEPKPK
jgi:hypothetical protein